MDDVSVLLAAVKDAIDVDLVYTVADIGDITRGRVGLQQAAEHLGVVFSDDIVEGANIGLIYNSGEANSVAQIDQVNEAAEGTSLSTSERTVSNSAEVQQAADTLSGDVDVFYIVTDNTVVSALDTVVDVAE